MKFCNLRANVDMRDMSASNPVDCMKYVVVTGGVLSGLGKGITASSIGVLLKSAGLRLTSVKIDPYLNSDAGTMSPFEHGEVFVLDDGGEVDDKVIGVIADDKRVNHIKSFEQLGEHWIKETTYYWEHYKDLKKPGTCTVNGFFGVDKAIEIIKACEARYLSEIEPQLID